MSEINWHSIDLGPIDAYAEAVEAGYTGTREEWLLEVGSVKENAEAAEDSAEAAEDSAEAAAGSATSAAASAAEAAQYTSTAVHTWLENNIDPDSGYALDRTLSEPLEAAPADMVGDLKSALQSVESITFIQFVKGYYINTSTATVDVNSPTASSSGYSYAVVPCSEGDVFTINGEGGASPRLWAFINDETTNNRLSVSAESLVGENIVVIAPTGATKLVLNSKTNGVCYKGESANNQVPAIQSNLHYGQGNQEIVTYDNWGELTYGTPVNLVIGANKKYTPGLLQSVKVDTKLVGENGHIYIVEVLENSYSVKEYTQIDFVTTGEMQYIPVSKFIKSNYYIFVECKGLRYTNKQSTYKTGNFTPGTTTSLAFTDNIQIAVGAVISSTGKTILDCLTDTENGKKSIYSEIVEKSYNNWDILTSTASGTWGTNKKYNPGFIKSIRLKIGANKSGAYVYIFPIKRDNKTTEFKAYQFDAVKGEQDIPINEYISYPFYVFTNAGACYYTNPGDGVYRSGTYNGTTTCSDFDATFQFAIGVVRNPAITVNDYWNKSNNIPTIGIIKRNIVLLGDSIVQGYGVSDYATCEKVEFPIDPSLQDVTSLSHVQLLSNHSWAMKFKTYIESVYSPSTVSNYGIGGLKAKQLIQTYDLYIDETTTDVIISIGTNSTASADKRAEITNPLISIINDLKGRGINVIVLTNTPQINQGSYFNRVAQAIIDACNATGITPINMKNEFEYYCYEKGINVSTLMNDELHPNDNGYELMYQIIKKTLKI